MNITPYTAFEELRFIYELLAAELVFLIPFVPMMKKFKSNIVILFVIYGIASFIYFPLLKIPMLEEIRPWAFSGWYIL